MARGRSRMTVKVTERVRIVRRTNPGHSHPGWAVSQPGSSHRGIQLVCNTGILVEL